MGSNPIPSAATWAANPLLCSQEVDPCGGFLSDWMTFSSSSPLA